MVFMYYAEYCKYGINVSYASMNGNAYDFYAFPTKAERDTWVEENEFDGANYVAANAWWSFPVAFSGTPAVAITARDGNWQWVDGLSNTGCTNKGSGGACAIAVGRWK